MGQCAWIVHKIECVVPNCIFSWKTYDLCCWKSIRHQQFKLLIVISCRRSYFLVNISIVLIFFGRSKRMWDFLMCGSSFNVVHSLLCKRLHSAHREFFLNLVNPNQILIVITCFRYEIKNSVINRKKSDIKKSPKKELSRLSENLTPLVIKVPLHYKFVLHQQDSKKNSLQYIQYLAQETKGLLTSVYISTPRRNTAQM